MAATKGTMNELSKRVEARGTFSWGANEVDDIFGELLRPDEGRLRALGRSDRLG